MSEIDEDPFKNFPLPLLPISEFREFKAARADLNKRLLKMLDEHSLDMKINKKSVKLIKEIMLEWLDDWKLL